MTDPEPTITTRNETSGRGGFPSRVTAYVASGTLPDGTVYETGPCQSAGSARAAFRLRAKKALLSRSRATIRIQQGETSTEVGFPATTQALAAANILLWGDVDSVVLLPAATPSIGILLSEPYSHFWCPVCERLTSAANGSADDIDDVICDSDSTGCCDECHRDLAAVEAFGRAAGEAGDTGAVLLADTATASAVLADDEVRERLAADWPEAAATPRRAALIECLRMMRANAGFDDG